MKPADCESVSVGFDSRASPWAPHGARYLEGEVPVEGHRLRIPGNPQGLGVRLSRLPLSSATSVIEMEDKSRGARACLLNSAESQGSEVQVLCFPLLPNLRWAHGGRRLAVRTLDCGSRYASSILVGHPMDGRLSAPPLSLPSPNGSGNGECRERTTSSHWGAILPAPQGAGLSNKPS